MSFESAARTHVGLVRQFNEDNFVDRPLVGLWAVADGMGGHAAGDVASGLIAEALNGVDTMTTGFAFLDEVRENIMRVNRTLVAKASLLPAGTVIGSTVVIVLAYGGHYACLWAGDSRAYLLRGGQFRRISRDHSMVQELIDTGNLSQAEARGHRRSNVITRAVGVHPELSVDMSEGVIEPGDIFLLCSDGLTGMLEDEEIADLLTGPSLDDVAETLIAQTLERGARDNVTVILVRAAASPDDTVDGQSAPTNASGHWGP